MQYIMVLSDGETWSSLKGCQILACSDGDIDDAMATSEVPAGDIKVTFDENGMVL